MMNNYRSFSSIVIPTATSATVNIKINFNTFWNARINDSQIGVRFADNYKIYILDVENVSEIRENMRVVVDIIKGTFSIVTETATSNTTSTNTTTSNTDAYDDLMNTCRNTFMNVFGFDPDADEKTQMDQMMESFGYKPKKIKKVKTPFGDIYTTK